MQYMTLRLIAVIVGILTCAGKGHAQESRYVGIPLQEYLNRQAIADGPGKVNFDGEWRAFPAAGFARTMMNSPAQDLPWPAWTLEDPHCISAMGQNVNVPRGEYKAVYLLASAHGGRTWCEFTLRYAGARLDKAGVVVPDWRLPPEPGDITALDFGFFYDVRGVVRQSCRTFIIPMAVQDQQALECLKFPFAPNIHVFGIVLDREEPLWRPQSIARLKPGERGCDVGVRAFESTRVDDPPVGYTVDPLAGELDRISDTGVTATLAHLFGWRMSSIADRQNDWRVAAKWLRFCYASDLPTVPIIENSPFWAAHGWLGEYIRQSDQVMVFADGSKSAWPVLNSEIYQEETRAYARKCVEWGNRNDPSRLIIAWMNGSDWHYPGRHDYSEASRQCFLQWLREHYTSGLADINSYWGTNYATWDDVMPPRIVRVGNESQGLATWVLQDEEVRAAWNLSPDWKIPVQAGEPYSAAVTVVLKGIPYTMVSFRIQWQDSQGYPVGTEQAAVCSQVTGNIHRYTWSGAAPEKASQAWLIFKTVGPGEAYFDDVVFMQADGEKNLVAHPSFETGQGEQPEGWEFETSSGQAKGVWVTGQAAPLGHGRCLAIMASEDGSPYGNPGAAVQDWVVYSWESLARAIDCQAATIKAADPSRKVVTEFDFAWAMSLCWDEVIGTAALDVGLSLADHTDIIGLKLCSARGDIHASMAAIDLARKYGKPMWATGLADYVAGINIGVRRLRELDQACIQHGATGLFRHLWHGVDAYAHSNLPAADSRSLIDHSLDSIRALESLATETDCALICPLLPYCADDPGGVRNDPFDFYGWYQLLARQQVPVDVITCYELAEMDVRMLNCYRLVVLPDAQWLPRSSVALIDAWVSRGGKLIISGRPVQFDQHGRPGLTFQCLACRPPADGCPHTLQHGLGKVVVLPEMAARRILGNMHRQSGLAGVPSVFVEEPRANQADLVADGQTIWNYCRHELDYQPLISLAGSTGDVEAALWVGPNKQLVFLLNRGEAIASGIEIMRPAPPDGTSVQVKQDGQDWREVQFSGGRALLPDFDTTCLVWMTTVCPVPPTPVGGTDNRASSRGASARDRFGQFMDRFRRPKGN